MLNCLVGLQVEGLREMVQGARVEREIMRQSVSGNLFGCTGNHNSGERDGSPCEGIILLAKRH